MSELRAVLFWQIIFSNSFQLKAPHAYYNQQISETSNTKKLYPILLKKGGGFRNMNTWWSPVPKASTGNRNKLPQQEKSFFCHNTLSFIAHLGHGFIAHHQHQEVNWRKDKEQGLTKTVVYWMLLIYYSLIWHTHFHDQWIDDKQPKNLSNTVSSYVHVYTHILSRYAM